MKRNAFEKVLIGEIAKVKGGKRLPKGHSFLDEQTAHPYIRGQDIRGGRVNISKPMFISDATAAKLTRYTVNAGDVCVTIVGNIGDVAMIPRSLEGANLTENAAKLSALSSAFDPTFVMYALLEPNAQLQMKNLAAGAAQPKLGFYKLEAVEVPVASLPTQRKIASILSAYDDLIENNTRRIAILEEMAQAIYREWFVNFRFPGHENVKLVDSPLGQIPEGWAATTLGSCGQVIPGYAFKSKDWQESGVPVVKIKNITEDNCVDMESADCVSASLISERMQKFMLETGDLLMAMTGATAGKAGVLRMRVPSALNQRVAKILPNEGYRSLMWCFLIGNQKLFFNLADGAAQPNMSGGQIESVPLLVPSDQVLSEFESCVADLAHLADSLYFKNRNLRTTRDLLLPKLISGMLDVEDLDIDSGLTAEVLEEATA